MFYSADLKDSENPRKNKKGRLAEFIVSKEYQRPLIATMLTVFEKKNKGSLTETLTSTMLVISSLHKVITIPGEECMCGKIGGALCVRVYVHGHFTRTCTRALQLISVISYQSFYRLFKCHLLL